MTYTYKMCLFPVLFKDVIFVFSNFVSVFVICLLLFLILLEDTYKIKLFTCFDVLRKHEMILYAGKARIF